MINYNVFLKYFLIKNSNMSNQTIQTDFLNNMTIEELRECIINLNVEINELKECINNFEEETKISCKEIKQIIKDKNDIKELKLILSRSLKNEINKRLKIDINEASIKEQIDDLKILVDICFEHDINKIEDGDENIKIIFDYLINGKGYKINYNKACENLQHQNNNIEYIQDSRYKYIMLLMKLIKSNKTKLNYYLDKLQCFNEQLIENDVENLNDIQELIKNICEKYIVLTL